MRCKVCGAESGKYPLCKGCNIKKERGEIIKCGVCGGWHYAGYPCPQPLAPVSGGFMYDPKKTLLSRTEQAFFVAIQANLPVGHYVFPQINLATFIEKNGDARFRNELFRNVDFLITDSAFVPKIVVEINDSSHLENDRRIRDKKVHDILEEAGIPMVKFWASYGVNHEYIRAQLEKAFVTPTIRKHNFSMAAAIPPQQQPYPEIPQKKQGCYVATCVYNSYDCPQVWTLRRYRDFKLSKSLFGRLFIGLYYAVSPTIVKIFGGTGLFRALFKKLLDKKVEKLNASGYDNSPYQDKAY